MEVLTREEKEDYLIKKCDENGFRKGNEAFRKGVSELSDCLLDLKIEILNEILEEN